MRCSCKPRVVAPTAFSPPVQRLWLYVCCQLEEISNEGELYRFIAQSSRAFDKAVYAKAQEQLASAAEGLHFAGPQNRVSPPCILQSGELSRAIVAVLESGNYPEFETLQETADR